MPRTIALSATALLVAACGGVTAGGAAPPETCVIVGGPLSPAEVRIYESNPYRAPAGKRLFVGLLTPHQRHRVATRNGRIWYAFRWHEGDFWKDGDDVSCRDGELVELP